MRNRSGATAPVFSCLTAKHVLLNRADCQTMPRAFRLSNVASDHVPVTAAELASPARNAALTIHGDGDPGLSLASIVVADRSQSPPEHVCNPLHIGSQRKSSHSLRADRDDASIIRTGPGNALPEYMPSRRQSRMISVISSGSFYGGIGPSSQVMASSSSDVPCSVASWSTVFQPTIWRCQLDCGPELVMARCSHTGPSPGS